MKNNIRKDIIEKELSNYKDYQEPYKPFKLTNKFIDRLFNHYDCHELSFHFYDSDLELDKELEDKDYCWYVKDFSKYSKEECFEAYKEAEEIRREYNKSEERLNKFTWVDAFGPGIWEMSQDEVNNMAKSELKNSKRGNHSNKDRYYISKCMNEQTGKEIIFIYYYSRDFDFLDMWYVFERINKKKRK